LEYKKLICAGLSNREIAAEPRGVASRTKLVARSRELSDRLIQP
jgi:hypothetical protein